MDALALPHCYHGSSMGLEGDMEPLEPELVYAHTSIVYYLGFINATPA